MLYCRNISAGRLDVLLKLSHICQSLLNTPHPAREDCKEHNKRTPGDFSYRNDAPTPTDNHSLLWSLETRDASPLLTCQASALWEGTFLATSSFLAAPFEDTCLPHPTVGRSLKRSKPSLCAHFDPSIIVSDAAVHM